MKPSPAAAGSAASADAAATIEKLEVAAFRVPTEAPESDGTLEWDSTTMVVVHARGADSTGLGFTFADRAAGTLIQEKLAAAVTGRNLMDVAGCQQRMIRAVRNLGRPGLASMAIAAVDIALWDLKARHLGVSLLDLFGACRETVPAYGSGGFTSYSLRQLQEQLGGWASQGLSRVKMKVGRVPGEDAARVRAAREVTGEGCELFVDANGAYTRKQALQAAECFAACDVRWFEEPVSSDDLAGLRLLRDRVPPGMQVAAGEYGYDLPYFRRMLEAGAVDVLQADATRCAGFTGFLAVDALCAARCLGLSAHTAPSLHAHVACACAAACHVEYFHDHARIEQLLFDGALRPEAGQLRPDRTRPGTGLSLRHADARRFAI
ncbi:MAG TPA: enolase C-terminal domain-like protein [Steroidobacteraceae bacterium]|nr:enolase C-terminal domain-like protein [Steroidobacteraceae bacterium]